MITILHLLGWLAAIGLAILSTTANFQFGTLLATGEERWLYGAIFGLLDVLKIVLLPLAAAATATGQRGKAAAALGMFLLLAGLSFTASIGLYATTKSTSVGDVKAAHERYEQARAARDKADSEMAAMAPTRSPAEVEGAIAASKRDRLFDRSKGCTDATLPQSRALCAQIDLLAGELGRARERQRLAQAAAEARLALEKQDVAAAMRAIDPQAETLARLIEPLWRADADTVRTALAVFIAILIELGSGLGPWLVAPSATAMRTAPPAQPEKTATELVPVANVLEPEPVALEAEPVETIDVDGQVEQWAARALVPRRGSFVPAAEVRAAYEAHCGAFDLRPLSANAFGRAMTRAGYRREKVGGVIRYENIGFSAQRKPQLRLAASGGAVAVQ